MQFLQTASTAAFSATFLAAIDVPDVLSASDGVVLDLGHNPVTVLAKLRDNLRQGAYGVFNHGFTLSDGASLLEVIDDLLLLGHTVLLFPTIVFKGNAEAQELLMKPLPLVVPV